MSAVVACLGEVMLESGVRVPRCPELRQTMVLDGVVRRLGGPAWNTAVQLGALGVSVQLGGVMGRWDEVLVDAAGIAPQVGLSDMIWSPASSDLLFYVDTPQGYSAIYQRATLPSGWQARWRALAASCGTLILAGSRHDDIRNFYVELAEQASLGRIIFAPNYAATLYRRHQLASLLRRADLVAVNEHEARHISRVLDVASLGDLIKVVGGALLITRQDRGAILYENGLATRIASVSHRQGDFIGAGDAFLAGMVQALLSGMGVVQAAACGAEVAASLITKVYGNA